MRMKSVALPLRSCRPGVILAAGSAAVLTLAWLDWPRVQLTFMALLSVILLAFFAMLWRRIITLGEHGELLSAPLALAQDQQMLDLYRAISVGLRDISSNLDPIYRELALERIRQITKETSSVAHGHIVFTGTETWRMVYERLLRSRGLYQYRSIAFVKTANYWQDEPGRRSMQANFEMQAHGLRIERIAVIPDHLWPAGERFPIEPLATWLDEQHGHGVNVKLVRQSALVNEPDLVTDLGIYGNRAVGVQELDEQGRTFRFTLSFDFPEVLAAEQRWERLSLYATAYANLLRQP